MALIVAFAVGRAHFYKAFDAPDGYTWKTGDLVTVVSRAYRIEYRQ